MPKLLTTMTVFCIAATVALADDFSLETTTEKPELPEAMSVTLGENGLKVIGPKRGLCDVWLLKELAGAEDFEKSATVTYPFVPGQLIGVMVVPRRSELTDFKGNKIESGTYTLRYGRQPQDGNHVGTSDTLDFLLAIPVDAEASAAGIDDQDQLVEKRAGASGTTHPAVFSLLPIEKSEGAARFVELEAKGTFALETAVTVAGKQVPLRLVLVGQSEGA